MADEIIVEEYDGQKIDDVRRLDVDIFTVGSDWVGQFDYLEEYCKVVYLDRTEGISSSGIRTQKREVSIGLMGESGVINKFANESKFVNGVAVREVCTLDPGFLSKELRENLNYTKDYSVFLEKVDAVYLASYPSRHYEQIKEALQAGKHVLCESPVALNDEQCRELYDIAEKNSCVLMDGIKTAYAADYFTKVDLIYPNAAASIKAKWERELNRRENWLFPVRKDMLMYRHRGGKPTILRYAMRIRLIIGDIFISWMEKESATKLLLL